MCFFFVCFFVFQAEDGIRDLVRSRGLGDVYKRQGLVDVNIVDNFVIFSGIVGAIILTSSATHFGMPISCLLYTSDAADERSSVDLGGRRIIQKKKYKKITCTGRL